MIRFRRDKNFDFGTAWDLHKQRKRSWKFYNKVSEEEIDAYARMLLKENL